MNGVGGMLTWVLLLHAIIIVIVIIETLSLRKTFTFETKVNMLLQRVLRKLYFKDSRLF